LDLPDHDLKHKDDPQDTINAYVELTPLERQKDIHYGNIRRHHPDIEQLSMTFGSVYCLFIQQTLDNTTQFARLDTH
jgi:hypothetical protein